MFFMSFRFHIFLKNTFLPGLILVEAGIGGWWWIFYGDSRWWWVVVGLFSVVVGGFGLLWVVSGEW